jgi:hypothetical protein
MQWRQAEWTPHEGPSRFKSCYYLVTCEKGREQGRGCRRDAGTPTLLDGRNVWNGPELRAMGFWYTGIGRP